MGTGLNVVAPVGLSELLAYGCKSYILHHYFADLLPGLRAAQPDANILMRYGCKNEVVSDPYQFAKDFVAEAAKWRPYTRLAAFSWEDNNPVEGAGSRPDNLENIITWRAAVSMAVTKLAPWLEVWQGPFSQPLRGLEFYRALSSLIRYIRSGVCINAYGTSGEIIDYCSQVMALFPPTMRFWLSEFNFGAGRDVRLVYNITDERLAKQAYAEDMVRVFAWADADPRIVGASYFAEYWVPDTPIITTINARGEPIGEAIKSYLAKEQSYYDSQNNNGGEAMDEAKQDAMIEMEARQNALLTEMWKRFRLGKFEGADGIDGLIVAMNGGKPLDFTPIYPPKN